MTVNIEGGWIEWNMGKKGSVKAEIPTELRVLKLVPFVSLYTVGDMV